MEVLLIGNYLPDEQISMFRFAEALDRSLRDRVPISCLRPQPVFGRYHRLGGEMKKWLGYVDKFVIFPPKLRAALADGPRGGAKRVVHIVDHSNAMYVHQLRGVPHLVTCHDLMAVRLALGTMPGPKVRWTGRQLQGMVRRGLAAARHVICISSNTRKDLEAVVDAPGQRRSVIHYELNYGFRRLDAAAAQERARAAGISDALGCVLHVGNNSWYKNRDGLLRIYARMRRSLGDRCPRLVIAGAPFRPEQERFIENSGLKDSIRRFPNQPSAILEALYSIASLFIFPSKYEGFGWPPIEAQACGCCVVAGTGGALSEVLGDTALCAPAEEEESLASRAVQLLLDMPLRDRMQARGFQNVSRFRPPRMILEYRDHYEKILTNE